MATSDTNRQHGPGRGPRTVTAAERAQARDVSLRRIGRLFIPYRQETYLLHTTVRENLRYARPDATDAEIETGTHTSLLAEDGRYAALAA